MKAVKRIFSIALAAAGVVMLAGCGSSTTSNKIATSANWNVATSTSVEENAVSFWQSHKEVATYSVTMESGSNSSYSVSYETDKASYTAEFYIDKQAYDWSDASIPDGLKLTDAKDTVYVYKTTYTISGKYTLSSGEETAFSDSTETVCKFRLSGDNLQPVYSYQKVTNTAPNALTALSKDMMCVQLNAEYTTWYSRDCSSAVVKTVNGGEESTNGITFENGEGYSVYDNAQIKAAVRGFSQSDTKTFYVYAPQNSALQACTATAGTSAELDSETDKGIISALNNVVDENGEAVSDYIFFDGELATSEQTEGSSDRVIRYTPMTLSIVADLTGPSTVYSYATVENADANATRAVLLKMTTTLAYGLGTLNYSLSGLRIESIS